MEDVFTALAAEWDTPAVSALAARPLPVRRPQPGELPPAPPGPPPGGLTIFEAIAGRSAWITQAMHRRDLSRAAQVPVLSVHVDSLDSPVTRYEVNPHRGTVAFTVAPPRPDPPTLVLPAVPAGDGTGELGWFPDGGWDQAGDGAR